MKRILTGAAALRREDRLQQREDRLSIKNSDLKAEVERLRKELIDVVAVLSAEVDFIASLTAENERLRDDLRDWADCCQMDTVMQGPARMGWNRSALDRCLDKYEAALQPKEGE